jgi:fructose-1,6-bisphosphatase/inositol monophosphatase family enzyme
MLYNTDCYAYGLLACGAIDVVIERNLRPYDYCALSPIIRNAGGYIANWDGEQPGLDSGDTIVPATSEVLANEVIRIVARDVIGPIFS